MIPSNNDSDKALQSDVITKWGVVALYLLLTFQFFFYVVNHAPDFPITDDVDNIGAFAAAFQACLGYQSCTQVVFQHYNEHRLVVMHLITAGVQTIRGFLDYRLLTGIGSFFWILIPAVICLGTREVLKYPPNSSKKYPLSATIISLPIFLALCNPNFSGTILWPSSSLAHHPCLVFSLLAIVIACGRGSWFRCIISLLAVLVAKLSAVGGTLAGLTVAFSYARRRMWGKAAFSAIFSVVIHIALSAPTPPQHESVLNSLFSHKLQAIYGIFLVVGSGLANELALPALFLGILFFILIILFSIEEMRKPSVSKLTEGWLFYFILFHAAIALTRQLFADNIVSQNRYIGFSLIAWFTLYIHFLTREKNDKKRQIVFLVAMAIALCFYCHGYLVMTYNVEQELRLLKSGLPRQI